MVMQCFNLRAIVTINFPSWNKSPANQNIDYFYISQRTLPFPNWVGKLQPHKGTTEVWQWRHTLQKKQIFGWGLNTSLRGRNEKDIENHPFRSQIGKAVNCQWPVEESSKVSRTEMTLRFLETMWISWCPKS